MQYELHPFFLYLCLKCYLCTKIKRTYSLKNMVIEQQITRAIVSGVKELYGADIETTQIQLGKTKK